jgi:hypothetical protein
MIGWYVNDKQFGIIIGLIVTISIAAIAIIILGGKKVQEDRIKFQEKRWNHGQCDNCGGEWRYAQAVGHCEDTTYLYVCDDCLNTVEIGEYRGN